ncbi:MAG: helix-turn-helix domain-containing protein [Actinomycetia bacterium]|nr:helix-turn-helix domain-containing protein [Actinomycetes bacterium]
MEASQPTEPLTISVTEAAKLLGIGRGTAYECVRTGELPSIKLGRRIVIPRRALDALLDTATTQNAA